MGDVLPIVPAPPAGRARADFACLSKKCRQPDGEAPVYELPAIATRCPVCSSKRIQRLFNSVNVMRAGFRPLNAVVDRALAEVGETYHDQKDARLRGLKREAPALAVPIRQVAGMLSGLDVQTGSRPSEAPFHPLAPALQGRTPIPGPGSQIDRESRVPA